MFHHLVSDQPVEVSESHLAYELPDCISRFEAAGLNVLQMNEHLLSIIEVGLREMSHAGNILDLAVWVYAELSLQGFTDGLFKKLSALSYDIA
ncbi:MAG: hypothetical protein L0229_26215 [Blastocatellia bacterium]|nr:hypothetical protein [Blastocatellia bacterium]